jgi:hypothetical protein
MLLIARVSIHPSSLILHPFAIGHGSVINAMCGLQFNPHPDPFATDASVDETMKLMNGLGRRHRRFVY